MSRIVLDWTDGSHWNYGRQATCIHCNRQTFLLDDLHRPSHKACAEAKLAALLSTRKGQSSMTPKRIQLRRTRGWRKPDNTVVVARPTKWGNPFKVGADAKMQPKQSSCTGNTGLPATRH
jgi:hypothetical protein